SSSPTGSSPPLAPPRSSVFSLPAKALVRSASLPPATPSTTPLPATPPKMAAASTAGSISSSSRLMSLRQRQPRQRHPAGKEFLLFSRLNLSKGASNGIAMADFIPDDLLKDFI